MQPFADDGEASGGLIEVVLEHGIVLIIVALVLGAAALCLYHANRLYRLLGGSPIKQDTFGFEQYQGSALQAVHSLKGSVNQMGAKLAARLSTSISEVDTIRQMSADLRERMDVLAQQNMLLQKELDRYRDGFLFAFQAESLSQLVSLRESLPHIEQSSLASVVNDQIGAILKLARADRIPADQLIGRLIDEETSKSCEVVGIVDPKANETEGVIADVVEPGYCLIGADTEGGRSRIIRKAKVKVYSQREDLDA